MARITLILALLAALAITTLVSGQGAGDFLAGERSGNRAVAAPQAQGRRLQASGGAPSTSGSADETVVNSGRRLHDAVTGTSTTTSAGAGTGRKLLDAVTGTSTSTGGVTGRKLLDAAVAQDDSAGAGTNSAPAGSNSGRRLAASGGAATTSGSAEETVVNSGRRLLAGVEAGTGTGVHDSVNNGRRLRDWGGYSESTEERRPVTQTRVGTGSTGGGGGIGRKLLDAVTGTSTSTGGVTGRKLQDAAVAQDDSAGAGTSPRMNSMGRRLQAAIREAVESLENYA